MNVKHLAIACVMATVGFNASAYATPLYSAISTSGAATIGSTTLADSFTTDSIGAVSEIEIALTKSSTATNGSTLITIYSDNGVGLGHPATDAPGSLVATIATVTDSQLTKSTPTLFDFTSLGLSLTPNTEYFLEIARKGSTTSSAQYYTDLAAPTYIGTYSGPAEVFYKSTSGSTAAPPEASVCISYDNTCTAQYGGTPITIMGAAQMATPEPASLGILGSGLIGFGFVASRRKRRALTA